MGGSGQKIAVDLDPDKIAGQMVVAGFEGKELAAEAVAALTEGRLSGVILFERNLGRPEEIRALTDSIRTAAAVPPFIAIDHEGGRVQRLASPFTQWPAMRAVGRQGDAELAGEIGRAIAAELLAVGINTNLAPVVDVDSNPANPVIGDRSFSAEAEEVARLAVSMISAFCGAGLVSCAKHFPGHGDTSVDSHLDLPVVEAGREVLHRRELAPFRAAVAAEVPLIMTAHVKVRALDRYYPATLSRRILTDLLREEMGFRGQILTDGLEMAALSRWVTLEDAAYSAARAGTDLLLLCSGLEAAERARQTLAAALKTGALDFAATVEKVQRICRVKEQYLLSPPPPAERLREVLGCAAHQELARRAAALLTKGK